MSNVITGLLLATSIVAEARGDWRYCYGFDAAQRRFFISEAAPSALPMAVLAAEFRLVLSRRGHKAEEVACPRWDSRNGISEMMAYASEYNRRNGNAVIKVDWSPARLNAYR